MGYETYRIADLIDEIAMGPFGSNIKVSCFVDSGVPVLNGSNLEGFSLSEKTFRYVTREKADSLNKANAHRGDIVITHRGTLGQIVFIPQDSKYDRYVISQSQFRVRCNDKVLPEYLVYYFHTPIGQHKLLSNASQVGVPALARPSSTFQQIEVVLPELSIQKRVVEIISTIQKKIVNNQELNDNLQQQLRTIFKAEFTDNPELEKMTQIPLSELCHVVTKGTTPTTLGKPFVESGINFIKAESILADHSLDKSKFAFIDEETNALLKRSVIHAGDIVFTIAGTLGRFALIDDNALPANTNQAVAIIRAAAEKVLPEYIYTCFIGEWHTDYYAKRVQQAVQANLSLTTIKSLPIPVLDKAKMDEYLRLILPLIKAIKGNEAQNEKLAALRDALLPKLMSGEIDVSDIQL